MAISSSLSSNFLATASHRFLKSSFSDINFSGWLSIHSWSVFETSCSEQAMPASQRMFRLSTFALPSVCFANYVLSMPVFCLSLLVIRTSRFWLFKLYYIVFCTGIIGRIFNAFSSSFGPVCPTNYLLLPINVFIHKNFHIRCLWFIVSFSYWGKGIQF